MIILILNTTQWNKSQIQLDKTNNNLRIETFIFMFIFIITITITFNQETNIYAYFNLISKSIGCRIFHKN